MELTRRNFVAGTAVATAAVAAGAVAPAVADEAAPAEETKGYPHTASQYVKSFNACTYDMDEPAPIAAADVAEWADEADIVVVGLGGGLAGAAYAAQQGLSVIGVDKAGTYGGTSKEACMYYFATNTRCQAEAGLPDLTDMLTEAALADYPIGDKYPKHIANCMQGIRDLVAWCEENGLEWEPGWVDGEQKVAFAVVPKGAQEGWNSYRIMTYAENFYDKIFTENGGKYYFNCAITGLVMDEGAVVGVECEGDGGKVYFKANKGVVLACGGFTNNIAMLKAYCPQGFYGTMINTAGIYDNGDAIRIGLGAGAQLDGMNNKGIFDGGIAGVDWNHHLYAADVQIARQPWLQVDTMGDRQFYNHTDYEAFAHEIVKMPEQHIFSFFDANWAEYAHKFVMPMCRCLPNEDMPDQERWEGILTTDWEPIVQAAIDEGRIVSADTPEELAEKLELPPAKLAQAFQEWNDMVASGDGSEWGYENPDWLNPLDTPPFYGQRLGCMMYSTRCGLSINENQQVIAKNGELIPGLYAAGQTSGRPNNCVCGDVGYGATSAYLAVKDIIANA